jgi:hypothetical protein
MYPKVHWLHLKPPLLYLPLWQATQARMANMETALVANELHPVPVIFSTTTLTGYSHSFIFLYLVATMMFPERNDMHAANFLVFRLFHRRLQIQR